MSDTIKMDKSIDSLVVQPFAPPAFLSVRRQGVAQFGHGDAYGKEKRELAKASAEAEMAALPLDSARRKLYELQSAIADLPSDVEMPLQHTFAPGVYVRTIFIPAGTVLVGKIHKHSHANILSQGRVTVFTEQGGTEDLEAPLTMVSEPGTKRAVLAHTDTVWTTIHPTDKTDLAEIEKETIAATYEEYEAFVSGASKGDTSCHGDM